MTNHTLTATAHDVMLDTMALLGSMPAGSFIATELGGFGSDETTIATLKQVDGISFLVTLDNGQKFTVRVEHSA